MRIFDKFAPGRHGVAINPTTTPPAAPILFKVVLLSIAILIFIVFDAMAGEEEVVKRYVPVSRDHSMEEIVNDALGSYAFLWAGYAISQFDVFADINEDDFQHNLFEVGLVMWDGDDYLVNFVGHPWYGSEYYLYYRSRGYSMRASLMGVFLVSCAFEFFVESTSQPPSGNDLVVTPVLGGLLGYYREKGALRLLNGPDKFRHAIGHILWLETNASLFENVVIVPAVGFDEEIGGRLFFSAAF